MHLYLRYEILRYQTNIINFSCIILNVKLCNVPHAKYMLGMILCYYYI